jgi:hypothetical protein
VVNELLTDAEPRSLALADWPRHDRRDQPEIIANLAAVREFKPAELLSMAHPPGLPWS